MLRTAHRRTLRAVMPDHVAHMLRSSYISNANDADNLCEETQRRQNNVSTDTQLIPVTITVSTFNHEMYSKITCIEYHVI